MLRRANAQWAAGRPMSAAEAAKLAADAYIFGYPLVLMEVTRHLATAADCAFGLHAPMNCFAHTRVLPNATVRDVVTPSCDTLLSNAWLDLAEEPMVLTVPDLGHRYYLMQLLDAWTNVFANPCTRTTGNERQHFGIVGPEWRGELPSDLIELSAPTNLTWLIVRIQTDGHDDAATVNEIQDQYLLKPLHVWPAPYRAPAAQPSSIAADAITPPVEQVARMDAVTFFGCLNTLIKGNPPSPADARALERFAPLGIVDGLLPGEDGVHPALAAGMSAGRTRIIEHARGPLGIVINGWEFTPRNVGRYGTNYLLRAVIAHIGLGANLTEDAVAASAIFDAAGRPLDGAHRYAITFAKGNLPPVSAFWSITLYNTHQTLAGNPLGRYALGDRDDLTMNADGSLTLYVQHDSPGPERESNWLPAPSAPFMLVMRLYWPSKNILEGSWMPPAVRRVS